MDQSQRPRYVSRFEHLALHPRLHHRVGFSIHYLSTEDSHRGNLHREGFVTTLGVPNSSLNTNTTSHKRGRPLAKQPTPLPKRVTTNLHLSLEGANESPDQPLPKRDTQSKEGLQLRGSTTSNNLFSTKQRS